jgi:hypothetical protein
MGTSREWKEAALLTRNYMTHCAQVYSEFMGGKKTLAAGAEIFIDPIVLSAGANGAAMIDHQVDWRKQHEIWSHANGIIASPSPSQQDLAAAVIQLQRAVELRDGTLDKLYNFTKIPNKSSKVPYPIMADLGIIRPTLKIQLRKLRNRLAHEIEEPSLRMEECELLSDTAWHYLKATDRLAQQCVQLLGIEYETNDKNYSHFDVTFNRNTWSARIEGNVSPEFLLDKASPDCLSIRLSSSKIQGCDGHLKFLGNVTGSIIAMDILIRSFFDVSAL